MEVISLNAPRRERHLVENIGTRNDSACVQREIKQAADAWRDVHFSKDSGGFVSPPPPMHDPEVPQKVQLHRGFVEHAEQVRAGTHRSNFLSVDGRLRLADFLLLYRIVPEPFGAHTVRGGVVTFRRQLVARLVRSRPRRTSRTVQQRAVEAPRPRYSFSWLLLAEPLDTQEQIPGKALFARRR